MMEASPLLLRIQKDILGTTQMTSFLDIIANGGDPAFGATMPGFGDQLTEEEAASILDFIKSSWGDEEREFQWWITVR